MELDSGDAITVHLRMTGELLFRATPPRAILPANRYLRARFALDRRRRTTLLRCAQVRTHRPDSGGPGADALARYGVEPLQADFTPERSPRCCASASASSSRSCSTKHDRRPH